MSKVTHKITVIIPYDAYHVMKTIRILLYDPYRYLRRNVPVKCVSCGGFYKVYIYLSKAAHHSKLSSTNNTNGDQDLSKLM